LKQDTRMLYLVTGGYQFDYWQGELDDPIIYTGPIEGCIERLNAMTEKERQRQAEAALEKTSE